MFIYILLSLVTFSNGFVESCAEPNNSYILSLNSDNIDGRWTAHNGNGTILVPAFVPGGIYTDLMNAKIIDDTLFEDNDVKTRWVAKQVWTYTRTFIVSKNILEKSNIDIVFDGLDTIAYILINGVPVGSTDNMFIRYKFNIKKHLQEGENIIDVKFDSPIEVAKKRSETHFTPPDCVPSLYNGECHANQLRKMQASFSWDWGPAFPSVGIWKNVNLEAYNSAVIRDVTVKSMINSDNSWLLDILVYMDASKDIINIEGHLIAKLISPDGGTKITGYEFVKENTLKRETVAKHVILNVSESNVKRWWPNGHGEQNLYDLEISFESTQFVGEFHFKTVKHGFRTVELIQDPHDSPNNKSGLTFYFKVNDRPIFMKGSNWIPANVLPELGYVKKTVDNLLESAKDAHMNMLRVWGGGVYESDYFYQRCDELGILIWQDLMFACSMYPVDTAYLSSVAEEVEQVVRRLQHHASLAVWAGNNENEVALRDNWYGTNSNFDGYKAEYIKLYVTTIKPVVESNDDSRIYVVSSPSNGLQSEKEGYIAANPGDPHFGDTHYYNYLSNLWSMDTYPKTRFCSEYGFQSLPSQETFITATNTTANLNLKNNFVIHRQHSPANGYANIGFQIRKQFDLLSEDDNGYFGQFTLASQIFQAMTIKTETEFYRQSRDDWLTMGALYWQLNDIWQAPSWAGIEYGGKWKMLHYFAKDFFSPVLISPRLYATDEIDVYLINDYFEPILNSTIKIDTFKWDNLTSVNTFTRKVDVVKGSSAKKMLLNIPLPSAEERRKYFYRFSLVNEQAQLLSPQNYIFPMPLKNILGLKQATVQIDIIQIPDQTLVYDVIVKTDEIALFVWLDVPTSFGRFSENGLILTEPSRTIKLYGNKKMSEKRLKQLISVKILNINTDKL